MRSLIKRARIVDPASEKDFLGDLYFSEGKLTAIGEDLFHMAAQADEIFDANGLIAAPGLVDMHVPVSYTHLDVYKRQPWVFPPARP